MTETIKNLMYQYELFLNQLTSEDYDLYTEFTRIDFRATKRKIFTKKFLDKYPPDTLEKRFVWLLGSLMMMHNKVRNIDYDDEPLPREAMYFTKAELSRFENSFQNKMTLITNQDEYASSCTVPFENRNEI